MTTGYCSEDYAKHHHGNWYDGVVEADAKAKEKEKEENRNKGA